MTAVLTSNAQTLYSWTSVESLTLISFTKKLQSAVPVICLQGFLTSPMVPYFSMSYAISCGLLQFSDIYPSLIYDGYMSENCRRPRSADDVGGVDMVTIMHALREQLLLYRSRRPVQLRAAVWRSHFLPG